MPFLGDTSDFYFMTYPVLAGAVVLAVVAALYFWRRTRAIEAEADERVALARREAGVAAEAERSRVQLDYEKKRLELERDFNDRRSQLEQKEDEALSALLNAEKERDALEKKRESYEKELEALEARESELRGLARDYRRRLEAASTMPVDAVREALRREVRNECAEELRELRSEILRESEKEIEENAKRTLLASMQRLASRPLHDITATIVSLPSDDMKGRIIGREGRNIKSFESVTGTTLLIDETPDSVLISSFDPVRREVARIALEALVKDGRIHPASIEEAVRAAEDEVKQSVIHIGEDALRRLRLTRVPPEVLAAVGKLRYRLSNNQNSLDHSIEVANLSALIASELGLDTELAKRAGLFHDIGKVLNEEYAGSHAVAGANFLKRFGSEDPRVINAIAAHHEEVLPESPYAPLLIVADSLSALRPGARAESIDSYIQRVRNLEGIARSFDGVNDVYAIQAGREIRVIVSPAEVNDTEARQLARDIRRRIEEELQYPGTIRVTVIRESRVQETAR